jgi:3-hydroxyisobutyrate dehydrogenase-like beta-hydroxyacid dehydrogenase
MNLTNHNLTRGLKIGWIGTGKMGMPMAMNLLNAGFAVTAYDTDRSRLLNCGFPVASSLPELSETANILISMIPDDDALRQVVLGANSLSRRPGNILIDLSTVSPAVSAECGQVLAPAGVEYIRGAVSGSTELARTAQLTVLLSGPAQAIERCQPLFQVLGKKVYVVGTGEEARYLKLLLNTMVAATAAMCAEALVLGEKGGLDWNGMLDVIADSVVASPLIRYKLSLLRRRDFSPAFTCDQMIKDLRLAKSAGEANGISFPIMTEVSRLFERTSAAGEGHLDFFAALRTTERLAGIKAADVGD